MEQIDLLKHYSNGASNRISISIHDINKLISNLQNESLDYVLIDIHENSNKYDIDFSSIISNIPIVIKYGNNISEKLSLEEYNSYRNSLKQLKGKIITDSMSPFEKLIAAYRYATSFKYEFHNTMGSAHNFIINGENGRICEDYCSFIREMLNGEFDIKISTLSMTIVEGEVMEPHAELAVIIDDDKYGIHGVYALDPTNDSYVEAYKNFFGADFSPGEKYERFMMPLSSPQMYHCAGFDLRITEGFDIDEQLILNEENGRDILLAKDQQNEIVDFIISLDEDSFSDELIQVKNNIPNQRYNEYLNADTISLDTLLYGVSNVLLKQGYDMETIKTIVRRVDSNMCAISELDTVKSL